MNIEAELKKIHERNRKVEADKAWETSTTRKLLVALTTYIVILLIMMVLKIDKPFINAIIPTFGFILSTLSVNFAKGVWINKFYKKK